MSKIRIRIQVAEIKTVGAKAELVTMATCQSSQ